jgi:disulfide bond formation protein DsbB
MAAPEVRSGLNVSSRFLFIGMAVASIGVVAAALFMQHVVGLNPCPLCILQRVAFLSIAFFSIIGAAWPRATRGSAVAALVSSLIGAGVAAWHVRLLDAPQGLSCGPGLATMLENFPLSQALPRIFAGSGDCTDTGAVLLGVSLAAWALLWFATLGFAAVAALARR